MFFLRQQISVDAGGSCARNISFLLLRLFFGLINRLLRLILLIHSLRGRNLHLLLGSLRLIVVAIVAVVILIGIGHRRWLVCPRNHLLILLLILLQLNLLFDFEFIVNTFKRHKNFGGWEGWIQVGHSLWIGTVVN